MQLQTEVTTSYYILLSVFRK